MIKDIMKTVAIIGGTQTDTLIKLGKKEGTPGTTSYRRNQTLQKESAGKYY